MENEENLIPISREVAFKICEEISSSYKGKWYTLTCLQCWGCSTFTRGDINKRCVSSRSDYRGCNLVNARFDKNYCCNSD